MSEQTALKAMQALDKDRMAVKMTVDQILHLLRDFIPYACIREAEGRLYDAFFINGVELTSNTMRKEYEYWKNTQLDILMASPRPPVQP